MCNSEASPKCWIAKLQVLNRKWTILLFATVYGNGMFPRGNKMQSSGPGLDPHENGVQSWNHGHPQPKSSKDPGFSFMKTSRNRQFTTKKHGFHTGTKRGKNHSCLVRGWTFGLWSLQPWIGTRRSHQNMGIEHDLALFKPWNMMKYGIFFKTRFTLERQNEIIKPHIFRILTMYSRDWSGILRFDSVNTRVPLGFLIHSYLWFPVTHDKLSVSYSFTRVYHGIYHTTTWSGHVHYLFHVFRFCQDLMSDDVSSQMCSQKDWILFLTLL